MRVVLMFTAGAAGTGIASLLVLARAFRIASLQGDPFEFEDEAADFL